MVGRMMAGSAAMSCSRVRLRSRVARERGFYFLAADHSVQSMSVPVAAAGLLRLEPITDPRFGQDMFRMGGVGLDLLTNLIDEDAQVLGLIAVIGTPHGLQQFTVRHRLT